MNLLQCIYCNQYAELKRGGRDWSKGRINGIILFAGMLLLNIFVVIILLKVFAPHSEIFRKAERSLSFFGTGRSSGKLVALLLFAAIGVGVYLLGGSPQYYQATVERFNNLDEAKQKKTVERALVYIILSIVLFIVLFVAGLIAG